jgi:signal transduction histidine kinase
MSTAYERGPCARVDDVIATHVLRERPARPPNHASENDALIQLAQSLAASSDTIAQELVRHAQRLCRAGSAGLSVLDGSTAPAQFRWAATTGVFGPHEGGTMPRDFSPCGEVLDRAMPLLMQDPARHYAYIQSLGIPIREVLLVPFEQAGRLIGTVWVVNHGDEPLFDAEDLRVVKSLAVFASALATHRGMLAALKAADRNKDAFIAKLSHELRNPLSPLKVAVQVLRRQSTGADPVQKRMLDVLDNQTTAMATLVDDLLDMSRIREGKLVMRPQRVVLQDVVALSLERSQPNLQAQSHKLEVALPEQAVVVQGDADRLAQVLCNLLNNAAKYTPRGGRIALALEREEGHAVLQVEDNGIGIPAHLMPRIFEMYQQAHEEDRRSQSGLGIGLALVRQLVELHGGEVRVRSEGADQGSRFTVRLPLAPAG